MMNNFGNKKCHSVILSSRGSMLKQGKSVKVGQRKDFVRNFPRFRGAMQIIFLFMTSPSAILQRGVQGTQPKEYQRNRCPQEGPHGQRERRVPYHGPQRD